MRILTTRILTGNGQFEVGLIDWLINICRVDTTAKLRRALDEQAAELSQDLKRFRDFYQFTFTYAKDPTQKGLREFYCLVLFLLINQLESIKISRASNGDNLLAYDNGGSILIFGYVVHIFAGSIPHFIGSLIY